MLFAWGTERWVVHSQVAGTKVIFEGGRLGSFATPRWSEKDGVGGFFLLRTFDTMGQFIQEIFGAEIGEVERGHGLLRYASGHEEGVSIKYFLFPGFESFSEKGLVV